MKAVLKHFKTKGRINYELRKIAQTNFDEDAEYVDIRFTDPRGKLQHVTVMSDQVDADFIDEGFMFDGSSIAGWKSMKPLT